MMKEINIITIILLMLFMFNSETFSQVSEQDSLALVAFYNSTNGAEWENNSNWLTGPVSDWYGIYVNNGKVIRIVLINNNLTGTLPPEIGNLIHLEKIFLSQNKLTGAIPPEIGNMANLKSIDFYYNELTDSIPPEIGNLSNLQELDLLYNELTGPIPPEIGNLTNLIATSLYRNKLTGPIPPEIGNLINLEYLNFHTNKLTDSLPLEIFNLTNLTVFSVYNNELNGTIPPEIGNLINLKELRLYANQFEGNIPVEIYTLTQLEELRLSTNNFIGVISAEIGNLTALQELNLHENQFYGPIPDEIGEMPFLEQLTLSWNYFTDLPDLSADTSLNRLEIEKNLFTFEDIEPNLFISEFSYAPQREIGTEQDTTVVEGGSFEFSVSVGGSANQYQWFKNNVEIIGTNSASFKISSLRIDDTGYYSCRITSSIVPELEIFTKNINLNVIGNTGINDEISRIPDKFALYQNFPNPFNPSTKIKLNLSNPGHVTLKIFNIQGQEIRTLVDEFRSKGMKSVIWDGTDSKGRQVAAGIYFYQIISNEFSDTKKLVLMK